MPHHGPRLDLTFFLISRGGTVTGIGSYFLTPLVYFMLSGPIGFYGLSQGSLTGKMHTFHI